MKQWLTEVKASDAYQDRVGDKFDTVSEWVEELFSYSEYLSDDQHKFLSETFDKLREYGEDARLTERQFNWLKGLHERLEERLTSPRSSRRRR